VVKGIERILHNGVSKVNYKDNSTRTRVYKEVASWTNITSILRVLCAGHIRLVISIVMVYIVVTLFVGNPLLSAETSRISNAPFPPSFSSGSNQGAENKQLEASSVGEAVEVVKYPPDSFLSSPPFSFSPHSSEQINQGYQTPLLTLGTNLQTFTTQASEQTPSSTRNIPGSQPVTNPTTDSSAVTRTSPWDSSVKLSPSATASPPAPPNASLMEPISQQPTQPLQQSAIQQQFAPSLTQTTPQMQLFGQTSPEPQNILPPTSGTILQQASVLPPLSTTFPPALYPPVSPIQPYDTSLTATEGYPWTTPGNAGTGATTSSVGKTSEIISPWFPSLPAMYCGGTFLLTIEGTPRGSDSENAKLEPSDPHGNDDKDLKYENSKDRRLLSLQVNSDNTRIFTDEDAIFGEIFLGKKNIDQNKGSDFDIKSIFNDCQIITYSKL
jgi:hypothetical protein